MKRIDKDFLNMEKCRVDLLHDLKGGLPFHLLLSVTLAFLAGLAHMAGTFGFPSEEWLIRLLPLVWLLPIGYFAGCGIHVLRKWLWIARTPFRIAEDTFCGAEEIMRQRRGKNKAFSEPILDHLEIHFSGHGIFKTTMTHATWSRKGNCMNCTALARSSNTGDKFYLLLDERVKEGQPPKIVLAYPCKYFEWRENG